MPLPMDEAVCASCGQPLGIRANWRLVRGRGYHNDCEPAPEPPPREEEKESLADHAERVARNILAPGQKTLEDPDGE